MKKRRKNRFRITNFFLYTALFLGFLHLSLRIYPNLFKSEDQKGILISRIREKIKINISEFLFKNEFPDKIHLDLGDGRELLNIHYTIRPEIQKFTDQLIRSYKPDYAAVVLLNAQTGEVLSLNSFTKDENFKHNLSLLASYPAASIFKIIPATAAIDKYKYEHDLKIGYNGSNHTLYKRNVMGETNRWSRFLTLEDAFAFSVNTVFAKLALNKLEPNDIEEYARKFLFNQPILTDFPVEVSSATVPNEKSYLMAEVASGFNKINKMSPVQGAMIAASIANRGGMQLPYIVHSLESESGKVLFQSEPQELSKPISEESAEELKKLMEATVTKGTSRKSFKALFRDKKVMPLDVGGKTGSLTGDNPKGKVDWFVGYAIKGEDKIAIAAITVNKEYWTVKSAFLAQEIFRKYFRILGESTKE